MPYLAVTAVRLRQSVLYNYAMPKKIRELMKDLEQAGFVNRGGKGSHRNFVHPKLTRPLVISGQLGADARRYQERAVNIAIEDSTK